MAKMTVMVVPEAGVALRKEERELPVPGSSHPRSHRLQNVSVEWRAGQIPRLRIGTRHQIGLPSLLDQLAISVLLGRVLSIAFLAVSAPATGNPFGSSTPICTSTEA